MILKLQDGSPIIYDQTTPQNVNGELIYKPFINTSHPIETFTDTSSYKFPVEKVVIKPNVDIQESSPVSTSVQEPVTQNPEQTPTSEPVTPQNNPVVEEPKPEGSGRIYSKNEKEQFKTDMYNAFIKGLKAKNIKNPEEWAKWLTAHDIIESGWGTSTLSKYYNFGGIKDNKNGVRFNTHEFENGKRVEKKAGFRVFKNLDDYVNYKIWLVNKNWNLFNYKPSDYATVLFGGNLKYGTSPTYIQKLTNLYNQVWS